MLSSTFAFILIVVGLLSGGLSVLREVQIMYFPAKSSEKRIFWSFVRIAFVIAACILWYDEHLKVVELSAASGTPKLNLHIDNVGIGTPTKTQVGDSNVIIVASLTNSGAPSIAEEWRLIVTLPGRAQFTLLPVFIRPGEPINIDTSEGLQTFEGGKDNLYDKAFASPLEKGRKIRGTLIFRVTGIRPADFYEPGNEITLACQDVDGNQVAYSMPLKGDKHTWNYLLGTTPPDVKKDQR